MTDSKSDRPEAPAIAGVEDEVKAAPSAKPLQSTGSDDQTQHLNQYQRTVASLKAQPQVRVKIPKGGEYVQINGWRWFLPEGRVMVPQQVADILEEAGRI